jgi:hypothetical protein
MLELDNVKTAIEHNPNYNLVDSIADAYFDLVELATRPHLGDEDVERLYRRRQFLHGKHEFITTLLERNQWMAESAGEAGSLQGAYLRVLAQVDQIMATV